MRERDLSDECRAAVAVEWQAPGVAKRGTGGAAGGRSPPRTSGAAGGLRIFESRVLDALTRTPPFVPYLVVGPVALWLAWTSLEAVSPALTVSLALAGIVLWTLVEYAMHRFLFHFRPSSTRGRVASFLVHGHHHVHPDDPMRITATPLQFGSLALLAFGLLRLALGASFYAPVLAGFLLGYLLYEAIHWRAHHGRPRTALGRALRRHHLRHHHDDPRAGWGISSPLWDWVFRTLPRERRQ